ncbi:MAG: hypothetical protein GTN76_14255 [Candidatus Aenigmarchaeota archaeon]|nr:hypothetical protein [Candidatus Aenigmarchaeota archaeon]
MRGVLVGVVLSLFFIPTIVSATDWYVRPAGGSYGNENGVDYNNAWDGLGNVVWGTGGVEAGDTLYICGLHHRTFNGYSLWEIIGPISSGSPGSIITIRGDCPGGQGIIWGSGVLAHESWVNEGSNTYSITIPSGMYSGWLFEDVTANSWTVLDKENTLQDCMNNPGSYYSANYQTGTKLYVHTSDNTIPTNRISFPRAGYMFSMNGTHHIKWQNLKFYYLYRTFLDWGNKDVGSYLTWDNVTMWYGEGGIMEFRGNDTHHIEVLNSDIAWSQNGLVAGPQTGGLSTDCAHDYNFTGNYIHDIGVRVTHPDAHCIGIQGGYNNLIEKNTCVNCGTGPLFYADGAVQSIKDTIVRWNLVKDCHTLGSATGYGISFLCDGPNTADKSGNQVYGNIVTNCTDAYRYKWEYQTVFYNNIAHNCDKSFRIYRGQSDSVAPNIKIRNHISLNPATYHIEFYSQLAEGNYVIDSDYNIFYPISGNQFQFVEVLDVTTTDFAGWQSLSKPGCTFDPNSLTQDPLFEDLQNGDFHLQTNSPAIDRGTNVGLTIDFEGNSIPYGSAPDIGAYEYQGTGNVWYVRPAGGGYGSEDGSSYTNAWDGLGNVVWGSGGIQAGDTLYICGLHLRTRYGGSAWEVFTPGVSGTGENARITIRGDCPGDEGIIWGAGIMAHEPWVDEGGGVWSITEVLTPNDMWYFEDITEDNWTVLKKTQTLAECRSTPGSYYSLDYNGGSRFYYHPSDGADPTGRIAANRLGYNLKVDDRHYITWLNLKFYSIYRWIDNYGNPPYPFSTHIRWENCTMWYGEHSHFLFRNNNAFNEFINCDIAYARNGIGFAEYPIGSGSTGDGSEPHDHVIRGCTFHHIGIPYGDSDSHAVAGQGSRNILIENNEMYLVGSGITFYCYNENQAIRNITVRYNWIHDTHSLWGANSRGIEMNTGPAQAPGTSADVYGNIVGPNVSSVCYRYFWTELGEFYNNVAYDCGTSFYIHHHLSPVNARIRNSISMNPQTYHIRFSNNNDSSVTSLDSDYNIFYPVDRDNFFISVPEARINDLSFSEWQTLSISGSNFDTHSLGVNPIFLNPANRNFHLHQNSPAIDSGINVGLTLDFDGNPLPQGAGFDIGAFEYLSGFTLLGDLNGDGFVDIADLAIIALHFGKRNIHPQWNATADVMVSDEIDVYDIVYVASRFT